jgi:hypothetical protein
VLVYSLELFRGILPDEHYAYWELFVEACRLTELPSLTTTEITRIKDAWLAHNVSYIALYGHHNFLSKHHELSHEDARVETGPSHVTHCFMVTSAHPTTVFPSPLFLLFRHSLLRILVVSLSSFSLFSRSLSLSLSLARTRSCSHPLLSLCFSFLLSLCFSFLTLSSLVLLSRLSPTTVPSHTCIQALVWVYHPLPHLSRWRCRMGSQQV